MEKLAVNSSGSTLQCCSNVHAYILSYHVDEISPYNPRAGLVFILLCLGDELMNVVPVLGSNELPDTLSSKAGNLVRSARNSLCDRVIYALGGHLQRYDSTSKS